MGGLVETLDLGNLTLGKVLLCAVMGVLGGLLLASLHAVFEYSWFHFLDYLDRKGVIQRLAPSIPVTMIKYKQESFWAVAVGPMPLFAFVFAGRYTILKLVQDPILLQWMILQCSGPVPRVFLLLWTIKMINSDADHHDLASGVLVFFFLQEFVAWSTWGCPTLCGLNADMGTSTEAPSLSICWGVSCSPGQWWYSTTPTSSQCTRWCTSSSSCIAESISGTMWPTATWQCTVQHSGMCWTSPSPLHPSMPAWCYTYFCNPPGTCSICWCSAGLFTVSTWWVTLATSFPLGSTCLLPLESCWRRMLRDPGITTSITLIPGTTGRCISPGVTDWLAPSVSIIPKCWRTMNLLVTTSHSTTTTTTLRNLQMTTSTIARTWRASWWIPLQLTSHSLNYYCPALCHSNSTEVTIMLRLSKLLIEVVCFGKFFLHGHYLN